MPHLFSYLKGCFAVVGRIPNWEQFFDLSPKALRLSFIAQFFILPAFYGVALAVRRGRLDALGEAGPINAAAIGVIGLIFLLSFSAVAYILTMVFDKQDRLRPWVIVRHWSLFFLAWISAAAFGLYILGLFPFMAANGVFFAAYMGLLFIDVRLAKRIVGFDWPGAILTGCIIAVTGMALLLTGVSYFIELGG
jgi:hypothetical protein